MKGFSLLEVLLATTLTLAVGMIAFQIFRQYEHTFDNQTNVSEAQQNARAVIFQINDEIRRAGQGVPVYGQTFESTPGESMASVLNGSDSTHLLIREGYSNVQADVLSVPVDYTLGATKSISVSDTSAFYNELGTTTPAGRFLYVWGSGTNSCWSWVRALLTNISNPSTLTLIPQQLGVGCRSSGSTVHFTAPGTVALEQAAEIYFSGSSIWRKAAADMTAQTSPLWNAASEIGRDFDGLTFTYYDMDDKPVIPATLGARLTVVRIDTQIHTTSGIGLAMRGYPENLRFH